MELSRPCSRRAGVTPDSRWRNRSEFIQGRGAIEEFLTRKWSRELDYRLIKEVWTFGETASLCGSPMSGATIAAIGSGAMEMRIGSSTSTD